MTRTSMRARYAGIWCTENCGTPKTDGCRCSRPQMVCPFRPCTVSTWTKSAARMPWACAVRNCFQVGPVRTGRRIDPGIVQDLPHRGAGDWVAELDELAESSEEVIDWRLVHQTGSYPAKDVTRTVGRRSSGRGGTGCFAVLGPQGVGQPLEVRHRHGERRVATSAKR